MDEMMDDREAGDDFGSIEGNYIDRHHVGPRVQLLRYVPMEESFPIPLRNKHSRGQVNTDDLGGVARNPFQRSLEH